MIVTTTTTALFVASAGIFSIGLLAGVSLGYGLYVQISHIFNSNGFYHVSKGKGSNVKKLSRRS